MLIMSHRGNVTGPNTINLEKCGQENWGVELDLRWDPEGWYFDHTPRGYELATDACAILQMFRGKTLAINIKEIGHEAQAVELLRGHPKAFVFDMELCGAKPQDYRALKRAGRISDRGTERKLSFQANFIWLDEFRPWVVKADLERLCGERYVYWVSPELHKPLTAPHEFRRLEERWCEMISWGVDGICTDYPQVLARCVMEWVV